MWMNFVQSFIVASTLSCTYSNHLLSKLLCSTKVTSPLDPPTAISCYRSEYVSSVNSIVYRFFAIFLIRVMSAIDFGSVEASQTGSDVTGRLPFEFFTSLNSSIYFYCSQIIQHFHAAVIFSTFLVRNLIPKISFWFSPFPKGASPAKYASNEPSSAKVGPVVRPVTCNKQERKWKLAFLG